MESVRRTILVVFCCLALLTVGPIAGAAQGSPAGGADHITAPAQTDVDGGAQPVSACFTGAGTEFIIGPTDATHIWVRLHLGGLTDSGWAFGGELIGSTGGESIVEIIAGIQFVGDGFFDFLTSPVDSFELVSGFDFQLPMLEAMTGEFTETGTDSANESSTDEGANGRGDGESDGAADSRFEMLRC